MSQSLFFNKVAGLRPKRLWRRCFPVNFDKFLRIIFLQNTSGRPILKNCLVNWNQESFHFESFIISLNFFLFSHKLMRYCHNNKLDLHKVIIEIN